MNYTKLVNIQNQFKYSANISLDLKNKRKYLDYILNQDTVNVLKEFIAGIAGKGVVVHSRILYGSYGTGKSHLLTIVSAILSKINVNSEEFDYFLKLIGKFDSELEQVVREFVEAEKPYLVVPVQGVFSDFGKSISYSLKKCLEQNNIKINFTTFFDEAKILLSKWKDNPESLDRLSRVCESLSINLQELEYSLGEYDDKAIASFSKVYEVQTYGAQFNVFSSDFIADLELANQKISGDYSGIILVFDEFGRYLEDNSDSVRVKEIQDLAEFCDHTNYNNHIVLVSHKQLSLYTRNMPIELSDEWKKVEGRFKPISLNIKNDFCLSLIGYMMPKSNRWERFREDFKTELAELCRGLWSFKGFSRSGLFNSEDSLLNVYPLHPVTLYALDKLAKKVAQNERTFFTYVTGDDNFSLSYQLAKLDISEFHFVGIDAIFDYFETNIASYKSDEVYTIYKKYKNSIKKLSSEDNLLKVRILKAVAVILIIADSEVITADKQTLSTVIDAPSADIETELESLSSRKILRYMRHYGYFDFFDSSIYDIDKLVEEQLETINDDQIPQVLNEGFADFVIYPNEYNFSYHVNRVFLPLFVNKKKLSNLKNITELPMYYDGVVLFVLDEQTNSDDYIGYKTLERSILLVHRNSKSLQKEVKRLIALNYLFSRKSEFEKNDPSFANELAIYIEEQNSIIYEAIRKWREIEDKNVFCIIDGVEIRLYNYNYLSKFASNIMFQNYDRTLIVNNDLLNKNNLTGAIKLARKKAIDSIFNSSNIYQDCQYLSPEHNILRSVLSKNGIYKDPSINAHELNRFANGEISGEPVMQVIFEFMTLAKEAPVSLEDLYRTLKQPPYGLRDGYIPVLVAYALREYSNVSLYFHGLEKECSTEELINAFSNVKNYKLFINIWTEQQSRFIEGLEALFANYLTNESRSRLKNLYLAMNLHYSSLPKCSRTTDFFVSKLAKEYRNIMSITFNDYNSFFFSNLIKLEPDYDKLYIILCNVKDELEHVKESYTDHMRDRIVLLIGERYNSDISKFFLSKIASDWRNKRQKAFDYATNSFLNFISIYSGNEEDFLEKLAKIITGFELSYWSDDTFKKFEQELARIIKCIEDYHETDSESGDEVKVTIDDGIALPIVRKYDNKNLSITGKVLFNKIQSTFDSFGQSVPLEEKIGIIVKILKDVLK